MIPFLQPERVGVRVDVLRRGDPRLRSLLRKIPLFPPFVKGDERGI
jgi:hypothetical protein